jgi:CRISPR-associated RAMP protein (TIGR02581 family)
MFRQLFNEATIDLRIDPDGPILIKASESGADPTRPDMEFVRTTYLGRETAYLPGSSLKGMLRSHCEKIARTVQPEELAVNLSERRLSCDPLDEQFSCCRQWEDRKRKKKDKAGIEAGQENGSDEIYRLSCFVCRLFGNTSLAGRLRLSDAYPLDPNSVVSEERNGVAIDRVFGCVAVGPFNYEVVTAGTFKCRISLRNFTIAQLGLLALALRDLELQRVAVGFAKSRGLGKVNAKVSDFTVRFPTSRVGETLKLLGRETPATATAQLPGVGAFQPAGDYGLHAEDIASLPGGLKLEADDWDEPCLSISDGESLKDLWRACAKQWRSAVQGR